jgi:uncharacterized protein YjiS (DUF1127 family)
VTNRGLLHPLIVAASVWLGTLVMDRCGYELLIAGQVGIAAAVIPLPLAAWSIVAEWQRRNRVVKAVHHALDHALALWKEQAPVRPRLASLAHYLTAWRTFAQDAHIGYIDESMRMIRKAQELDYYSTGKLEFNDLENLREAIDGKAVI